MAQAALDNLNAAGIERPKAADGTPTPIPNTADTGYFSEEAVEGLEKMGIDPHLATGRQKHHEAPAAAEAADALGRSERQGKDAAQTPFGDRQSSLRGAQAHRRAGIRQIKSARGIRKFLLRGLEKVSAEWQLICLTHNLLKIWRRSCSAGVS